MPRNALRNALAIPASLLLAAAAMRALLAGAPHAIAADLAQPLAVVTNWHGFGASLLTILAIALAVATFAYVRLLREAPALSPAAIVLLCALAVLAAWCVPVCFSSDVYAYATYGELARTGGDPYGHAQLAQTDPVFAAAIWQWGNPPPVCVYGPLFVAIAALVVGALAHLGVVAQLDGLRALASCSLPLCCGLAYLAYPGNRAARSTAAAAIGLNPVAVWSAAEGHNDALALAFAIAAYALVRRRAAFGAAALIAASGLVKLFGVAAAAGIVVRGSRERIAIAAAMLVTFALCLPLLRGALLHAAPTGRFAPQASLEAAIAPLVTPFVAGVPATVLTLLPALAIASIAAVRGVRLLNARALEGWAWLAVAAWALVPNPFPWYGVWLVAVAAAAPRSRGGIVLMLLSLTALLRYVPDAVGVPGPAASIALGVAASLPLAALLFRNATPAEPC